MGIVHFYNFREVLPTCDGTDAAGTPGVDCFYPPEVAENINTEDMGNLNLSPQEGMALIKFLMALTDNYQP